MKKRTGRLLFRRIFINFLNCGSRCCRGLWLIIIISFLSCARGAGKTEESPRVVSDSSSDIYYYDVFGAVPMAILQTGEFPIWFKLTDQKPVHIGSIEDMIGASAFVPWPYAPHIRFLQKENDELVMVINRGGFLKIAQKENVDADRHELAVYNFSSEIFRQYTTGGFFVYNDNPAALLYLDDRFMETTLPKPRPQIWSFNMESNNLFSIEIPVFKFFPEEDGWSFDAIRKGNDGLFYYRAAKRNESSASVKMFRTENLTQQGAEISIDVFYNSAPRKDEISHPSLPALPEGFVYTETAEIGENLFASWEEQKDYSIGAAGFMLKRK